MSTLLKKLHVHFEDDVPSGPDTKPTLYNELADQESKMLNYSRAQLLAFGQSEASKLPPKMFDLSGADDKRMEKIRHVLKNSDIWNSWKQKNGAYIASKGGATENSERTRSNFQQMISAAVSNAQQHNVEMTTNRRRIGSGRIPDTNYSDRENIYAIGMDVRYMRNNLFKEDGKTGKNWKGGAGSSWMQFDSSQNTDDTDNTDAKSDEPEWANCGPVSKHDIIELHGFDGPEDDETQKSGSITASPPAHNSTPSKPNPKMDEHFNFEDFLKLDLPPSVNCSHEMGTGESRFSQWFGREAGKFSGNSFEARSTKTFFDYHQKATQKKMNVPNKLRSVNELEAGWCPPSQIKSKDQQTTQSQPDINAIRITLNQLAAQAVQQHQRTMSAAQTNFLLGLINKGARNLNQLRSSQNATMKRPDAQLLLHRLVNGEITQFHILQQISNPTIHQHDRETLLAVFAFCNENQQWLLQQQEQQLKHKAQMSQQLRQLSMINLKGGNMQTGMNLQFQNILQNAMLKKQADDQFRNGPNMKIDQHSKFKSYKTPSYVPTHSQHNRFSYKQQKHTQYGQNGQNGLQFIQSQNKLIWNRHNQQNAPIMTSGNDNVGSARNTYDLFASMPEFSTNDKKAMPVVNDMVAVTVNK